MKLMKVGLAVCTFALIVGSVAPLEAGGNGMGACTRERQGGHVCWDDVDEEMCSVLSGEYRGGASTCDAFGPFEGACAQPDVTGQPECCLIGIVEGAESDGPSRACSSVDGDWFGGGQTCEDVPVELQTFEVEKK